MSENNKEPFYMLEKYKSDLNLLKNGRDYILRNLKRTGTTDDVIEKKLVKLNKSIDFLENAINQFEKTHMEEDNINA